MASVQSETAPRTSPIVMRAHARLKYDVVSLGSRRIATVQSEIVPIEIARFGGQPAPRPVGRRIRRVKPYRLGRVRYRAVNVPRFRADAGAGDVAAG